MELNKRKYNLAIIFLIILITSVTVFSSLSGTSGTNTVPGGDIGEVEAGGEKDDQDEETDDPIKDENAPFFNNAFDALDYTLDIVKNGSGYKCNTSMTILIDAPVIGKIKQTVNSSNYKNKEESMSVNLAKCSNSMGDNFYEYVYMKNGEIKTRKAYNTSQTFSPSDEIKTYGETEYMAMTGGTPGNETGTHSLKLNKSTVAPNPTFSYSKGKYTISFVLKSDAWEQYEKTIEYKGGSGSNPKIRSMTVTLVIDVATGYLLSAERNETYEISRAGFRVTCTCTTKDTYVSMNRNVKIAIPE